MAKPAEDDVKRKKGGAQKALTGMMTAMLVIGLAGFGFTSFNGSVSSIGTVGAVDISTNEYARTVQQKVAEFSNQVGTRISVQDGLQFGMGQQALTDVITRATLDNEARALGLSVGDQTVAAEVMKQTAFTGASGSFDRAIYSNTLRQNGWSEADYEDQLRRDVSRSLLQGAVAGGITAPAPMVDTLYAWIGERRGFSMIRLTEYDLAAPLPEPTEAELQAFYDAHTADFTRAEAKRIRYAALLPNDIAADQPVDEAAVRKIYDDNIAEYVVPERRLVERLIFPDAAARDAALAQIAAGTTFETLVTERGLTMDAADMGDVSQSDLGAAGDAVFAAAMDAVVPGETDLGPALFRVNGTLDGESRSFDEVRAELAAEMQFEEARKVIADRVDEIDDLLAGGETLDTLAAQTGMTVATLDHVPGQQGSAAIEGYQAFRQAADAVTEGDFAEAVLLDDGGVVTLEFVETVPAHPIPFAEAQEAVTEAWRADALKTALTARAAEFKTAADGGATLLSLGIVDQTPEISRDGTVEKTPADLLPAVFEMTEGETRVFESGDFIALLRLDTIKPAAETGDGPAALKAALSAQIERALADDAFAAFTDAASATAGVTLDQNAINLVNSSLQ